MSDGSEIDLLEAVALGAEDGEFYSHFFFPKAFRQQSPPFHAAIWSSLDNPDSRFVNVEVLRGGAKTTLLRSFTSRRIAYGLSRTILFVGKGKDHAVRSIEWLMRAVEYNSLWAQTFQLRPGKKWTGEEIEIIQGVDNITIRVIALGITGQIRGINVDDFRPDLIVVDDPLDEENTNTSEQREKINNLFFGALQNSLSPASESPMAMMALLNTPLNGDDLGQVCAKDPQWDSHNYSCFDAEGESSWPARFPTAVLLEDKASFMARNMGHLWFREMECKITASALAAFKTVWLNYWEVHPEQMYVIVSVDPTPPPRDGAKPNASLDDAVVMATGFYGGNVYLLEYFAAKSPNPLEFVYKIFEFVKKWQPRKVGVETILFQRVLSFIMRQQMQILGTFFYIVEVEDKRKKDTRIRQAITNRASNGSVYVHRSHMEFIEQYTAYPNVNHDDYLDAFAIALCLMNPAAEGITIDGEYEEIKSPELLNWRACP